MPLPDFPASHKTFIATRGGSKSRIFLYADAGHDPASLQPVTTVNLPAEEVEDLLAALNERAWTGRAATLPDHFVRLPEAVVQACQQALADCPDPSMIAVGANGAPLRVVSTTYFTLPEEVADYVRAAMSLDLQVVVSNARSEGRTEFRVSVLSGDVEVPHDGADSWPGRPPTLRLLSRKNLTEEDLEKDFAEGRWGTYVSRAYWLWVQDKDDSQSASAECLVETFHELLDPAATYLDFIETEYDEEEYGPLTPRNRFVLYMSMFNITVDLDSLLSDWEWESQVRNDLPPIVQSQPRAWWRQIQRAADRLFEAARMGDLGALVPRTPAEEALLFLASRSDYVGWAMDAADMHGTSAVFEVLPEFEDDGDYLETLPFLTGDADIELLWSAELDGLEDPDSLENKVLGIGDYRAKSWHQLFDRALRN